MNLPICHECLNSELLCPDCQEKLDSGEISQNEVDFSRSVARLSERYHSFEKAELVKTMHSGNISIVVVPKGTAGNFIGRRGIFIKELSSQLGKRVKVIEETKDVKDAIQNILFPARFLGINVMYASDGKEVYKVRVSKSDIKKIPEPKEFEAIFTELLDKGEARLVFE